MKNGYTMPYYPYAGGKVDFKKRAGLIPPLEKLEIKKAIKAAIPADVDDGISHGQRQALVVFTLPNDNQEYATPVGAIDAGTEQYYDDLLFFYDDPHTIYSHWPKEVWSGIESHQVKPGMNELQARLAVGQKIQTDNPQAEGNRTVTYDADGKKWTVTFRNDKAITVNSA
jgi:flagellar motor protein MotB